MCLFHDFLALTPKARAQRQLWAPPLHEVFTGLSRTINPLFAAFLLAVDRLQRVSAQPWTAVGHGAMGEGVEGAAETDPVAAVGEGVEGAAEADPVAAVGEDVAVIDPAAVEHVLRFWMRGDCI